MSSQVQPGQPDSPTLGAEAGQARSWLPVSMQEGRSIAAGDEGGLLLEALHPEATVRGDGASGGCVIGLRCAHTPPASLFEVAIGKVRRGRASKVVPRFLLQRSKAGHPPSVVPPPHARSAPYRAAAVPPLPGTQPGQAVLDGTAVGRLCRAGAGRDAAAAAGAGGEATAAAAAALPSR